MSDLHPDHEDHPRMISRAARSGLVLFFIYFVLFLGFLLLNVFAPDMMSDYPIRDPYFNFPGINLALFYGLFLIFMAILLALQYMRLTRPPRKP